MAGHTAGHSGSLKERKFSLLYRDVLDCASHVLKSKDEFQAKYRETQERINRGEIAVREMILELEEDFKVRLGGAVKKVEGLCLAGDAELRKALELEKTLREGEGKKWSAGLERGMEGAKDW